MILMNKKFLKLWKNISSKVHVVCWKLRMSWCLIECPKKFRLFNVYKHLTQIVHFWINYSILHSKLTFKLKFQILLIFVLSSIFWVDKVLHPVEGVYSFHEVAQHIEVWIAFIDNLKSSNDLVSIQCVIGFVLLFFKLTFLNVSRLHVMLPKHSILNGFCDITSIVGNILCNL